ncbi:sensor histidine kinase [Pedobacter nutrimenti]|jgi:sensor histidine kinase YesM|uniref:Histidine kinase n=1 Tax=Pedobacter nutrimenti TaxID=1241337 RepID=A0A318U655_9SPHI|nr:histidine kinase [Pedobacter nutrimenti]PYF68411.1 histidine kinase [Pedobacter nutrimenti]
MRTNFYIAGSRLLTHTLFWVAYVMVYTGVHADGDDGFRVYFLNELQGLPAAMLVAYVNLYVLFPRFFAKQKYLLYCLSAILLLFCCSLFTRVLSEWYVEPVFLANSTHPDPIFIWYFLFKGMLWFLSPVLLFTLVIRIFQQWFIQQQQQQEMIREKLNAELNFLKAQVHPHFLFNTLNNLYALTLESSPKAPKVVLKLSELMSYMLYDSQSGDTFVQKEISHIRNYIELEKLRYSDRLEVSLNVSGKLDHKRIAPLLLIPFVENAFKHGLSNDTDQVWVTVDVKVKAGWLIFKTENSCAETLKENDLDNYKGGIGLQNVRRRLILLYPDAHELKVSKEPGRFTADLKIKLN